MKFKLACFVLLALVNVLPLQSIEFPECWFPVVEHFPRETWSVNNHWNMGDSCSGLLNYTKEGCLGYYGAVPHSEAISRPFTIYPTSAYIMVNHSWEWNSVDSSSLLLKIGSAEYLIRQEDYYEGKPDSSGFFRNHGSAFSSRIDIERLCFRETGSSCEGKQLALVFKVYATGSNSGGHDGWTIHNVNVQSCRIAEGEGNFYLLENPCRLYDSRTGSDINHFEGIVNPPGRWIDIHVDYSEVDPVCSMPYPVKALLVNITVTEGEKPGWLRVDYVEDRLNETSMINFVEGQTIANNQIVQVAKGWTPEGNVYGTTKVYIRTIAPVHVVLDVSGYVW